MGAMAGFTKRLSGLGRHQRRQDMPGTDAEEKHERSSVAVPVATHGSARRRSSSSSRPTLLVRFWGVRGSYPTVSANGSAIGGNTTCIEIRSGRQVVVIDAGSGAIPLGEALSREWRELPPHQRPALTMLFTHAHHDHLCGLPFFAPLFNANADLALYGPDLAGMRFEEILGGYMRPPYFPVDFRDLPSHRTLSSIHDGARLIWPNAASKGGAPVVVYGEQATDAPKDALVVDVLHSALHPQNGTLIYRVSVGGHCFVFATDVEIGAHGPEADARLIAFAQGADALAHDAQYSARDYYGAPSLSDSVAHGAKDTPTHYRGFGHSTPEMAARVAVAARVKQLVLVHHNPLYDDAAVLALESAARQQFANVTTAHEGLELHFGAADAMQTAANAPNALPGAISTPEPLK